METGYIEYNGKLVKVTILEKKSQHTTVETEDNELLCIPQEANVVIWPTKEMYFEYKSHPPIVFWDGMPMSQQEINYRNAKSYIEDHKEE